MSSEHVSYHHPDTSSIFLALAGWSHVNLTSRSVIRAQRAQITTSSETKYFGKGKRKLLVAVTLVQEPDEIPSLT